MFGISGMEFLIILTVAIIIVPVKKWPDVARFIGSLVRRLKIFIGKVQDEIDNIHDNVAKDIPVDSLSQKTMDDMIATFRTPSNHRARRKRKK